MAIRGPLKTGQVSVFIAKRETLCKVQKKTGYVQHMEIRTATTCDGGVIRTGVQKIECIKMAPQP